MEDIRRARAYLTLDRQEKREFEIGVPEMEIWVGVER